ncbi:glycosyltransferase family 2 protein [soil metagenome]
MHPTVSIIIVTYNGYAYINRCVQSIVDNPYKEKQIIIVDNGSTDGTVKLLKSKYSNINIIALPKNIGPSAARNEGIKQATGEYVMFLDNDTQIHKNTITEALKIFEQNKNLGLIQCKLLFTHDPTLLDCTGEYVGQWGFLVHRTEVGQNDDNATKPETVFSAKSAGMIIRGKTLDEIGGFDPDYFIYLEETDLAWRAWHHGYKALYVPKSIVYHESGTSSIILSKKAHDYNGKFHGCKNYILTLIKNLELKNLVKILPIHIILWVGLAYYSLLQGKIQPWIWIHQAIWWNIWHIHSTLRKRMQVQKNRQCTDDEILPQIMKKKPLSYYTNKVKYIKVGNAEGFIKS